MCKSEEMLYFQDILDSIKKIEQYTKKMSFDDFMEDNKTVDGGSQKFGNYRRSNALYLKVN